MAYQQDTITTRGDVAMGKKSEALASEFEQFKQTVRAEAIRVAREQGWCDSGLNRSLSRLGLPEKRDVRVRVQVTRTTMPRQYTLRLADAETEEQARQLLADPARLEREVAAQLGYRVGRDGIEVSVVGAPAAAAGTVPADAGTVPQVGQPCPAEGAWYRVAQVSGDPGQCREREANEVWYCTRPAGHEVSEESPHVAAGRNLGVRAVWTTGGVSRAEFEAREDEDEPDDISEASTRW